MPFPEAAIQDLIRSSNHDAICRKPPRFPFTYPEGMADLITSFHRFEPCPCDSCDCRSMNCNCHWIPIDPNLAADDRLLEKFRGAFAMSHLGEQLGPGHRGRSSMNALFGTPNLRPLAQNLWTLSASMKPTLACDIPDDIVTACATFWQAARRANVTYIYISKFLSFVFPDLFIPFDSNSKKRYQSFVNADHLIDRAAEYNVQTPETWADYLDAHRIFRTFLLDRVRAKFSCTLTDFRDWSFEGQDNTCCGKMTSIGTSKPPPPISRPLDKIFYTPRHGAAIEGGAATNASRLRDAILNTMDGYADPGPRTQTIAHSLSQRGFCTVGDLMNLGAEIKPLLTNRQGVVGEATDGAFPYAVVSILQNRKVFKIPDDLDQHLRQGSRSLCNFYDRKIFLSDKTD